MTRDLTSTYLNVTAALIASGGRLFVAQRPPWKRFGLLWEFPGGKVETGEGFPESLVREIREELCLDIEIVDLFRSVSHCEEGFSIHLHAYWCSVSGGMLCLQEHVAFKWAAVSELEKTDLTLADRLLIPFLKELSVFPEFPGTLLSNS